MSSPIVHRPSSIVKIVPEIVYQLARNEHARYRRYRVRKRDAPPKLPPSQRPVLQQEDLP